MAMTRNQKKLKQAEDRLAETQRKIRRLMTAQKSWERRVKYYTPLVREEAARAEAEKLATKILNEKAEKEERDAKAFMDSLNQQEGRMFRHD